MRALQLTAAGLTAVLIPVAVAVGAASKPAVIADRSGDAGGALDLRRVAVQRASDGRLRTVITFAAKVTPAAMLAAAGPPGAVCLRIWTAPADPAATRPDRLVCVTARSKDELRAGVFEQRGQGLPARIGPASVAVNESGRSLVVRVSQSALGGPERIRFAVESTGPGCDRTSCVDTIPDAGRTRRFRLR